MGRSAWQPARHILVQRIAIRFRCLGRVVEKKLKRETQQKLDRAEQAEDPLLPAALEQKERLGNERACRES